MKKEDFFKRESRTQNVWKAVVFAAIILTVVLFILEITIHLNTLMHYIFEALHIIALGILFVDLILNFISAENKTEFLKKNALLIISFFPLASMFANLSRGAQATRMIRVLKVGTHATELKHFPMVAAQIEMGLQATRPLVKTTKIVKHFLKEDKLHINLYVEPTADKTVVRGILTGINHFCRHNFRSKIQITRCDFSDFLDFEGILDHSLDGGSIAEHVAKICPQRRKKEAFSWNILITGRHTHFSDPKKVFGDTNVIGSCLVSVYNANKVLSAVSTDDEKFKKGHLIGYYNLTSLLENAKCSVSHCVHNMHSFAELNSAYHLYEKFGSMPCCMKHAC